MIKYEDQFVYYDGGTTFPTLRAINESPPGANNGTELIKAKVDDEWGRTQALIWHAYHIFESVPNIRNGLVEGLYEAGDSQYMESLAKAYAIGAGSIIWYAKAGDPAINQDRVLILSGQGIDLLTQVDSLFVYDLLDKAVYVGDTENPTAPAFYHFTSLLDPDGTRSLTGRYLKLPNAEGRFVRSVDPLSRPIGDLQAGGNQDHRHFNGHGTPGPGVQIYDDVVTDTPGEADWFIDATNVPPWRQGVTSDQRDKLTPYDANGLTETRPDNIAFRLAIVY
jgi:hypothetical protein